MTSSSGRNIFDILTNEDENDDYDPISLNDPKENGKIDSWADESENESKQQMETYVTEQNQKFKKTVINASALILSPKNNSDDKKDEEKPNNWISLDKKKKRLLNMTTKSSKVEENELNKKCYFFDKFCHNDAQIVAPVYQKTSEYWPYCLSCYENVKGPKCLNSKCQTLTTLRSKPVGHFHKLCLSCRNSKVNIEKK